MGKLRIVSARERDDYYHFRPMALPEPHYRFVPRRRRWPWLLAGAVLGWFAWWLITGRLF